MKRSHPLITTWILAAVLCAAAPAGAVILNPSFEDGLTGWTTVGNASVADITFGVTPTDGALQLVLSTDVIAVSPAVAEQALGFTQQTIRKHFRDNVRRPGKSRGKWPIEGSAVQQTFEVVEAGDYITFDWNFLTNEFEREPEAEPDFYTDFFWGILEGPTTTEEFVFSHANETGFSESGSDFDQETGSQTFSFTFLEAGTYTLTLGVFDIEDAFYDSGVVLDGFQYNRVPEPNSFLLLAGGLLGLNWHRRRCKTQRASS